MAGLRFPNPPAAEGLVQIESPVAVHIVAISRFEVGKPVARNVDKCRNASGQDTGSDQDDPDLTSICKLLHVSQDAACASVQIPQALALLCVFKDPVDSGKVVVAYSAAGAFDVPVQAPRILGVLGFAGAAWSVEIVQEEVG